MSTEAERLKQHLSIVERGMIDLPYTIYIHPSNWEFLVRMVNDKQDIVASVRLLPHRAHWHLTRWENLSRRERRRLRKSPVLLSQQRAWVEAFPARFNATLKRVYSNTFRDLIPPDHPLLRSFDCEFVFPTSK